MSAAQRAAPTVFVKVKKIPATGISSRRTAGMPKLAFVRAATNQHLVYSPSICSLALLDELLLLLLLHLLELEVPSMRGWAELASLKHDKNERANNRDGSDGQVHEIPDDGLGSELCKGGADKLAQLCDGVASRFDLAFFGYQRSLVAADQCAVKGINQGIVDEKVLAQDGEDGRRLAEDKQNSGKDGERAVEDGEKGSLRDIGDGEHHDSDTQPKGDGRDELGSERLP